MKYIWKYNAKAPQSKQHCFYALSKSALCGVVLSWKDETDFRSDREGLEKRQKCRRCLDIL